VAPLAPQAWAEVIEELLANPDAAGGLGAAARRTARVTFSLDRTVDRTAQLYRLLLDSSQGSQ
jgi:glycosyltransferase involved in cell wall biosynthesis